MPEIKLSSASQLTSLADMLNYVEKLRKEVSWLVMNLDTSNVNELNANVLNAGTVNTDLVTVKSTTSKVTVDGTGLHTVFTGGATLDINKDGLKVAYADTTKIEITDTGLTVTFPDLTTFVVNSDGVTVDRGHYFLKDASMVSPEIVGEGRNMLRDHSFESIMTLGNADAEMTYAIDPAWHTNTFWWTPVGNPRVRSTMQTDAAPYSMFGYQSLLVNSANYMWQGSRIRAEAPRGPYNFSVFAAPRGNNTPGVKVECAIDLEAYDENLTKLGEVNAVFEVTPAYSASDIAQYVRGDVTYPVLPVGTAHLIVVIGGGSTQWVEVDGASLVPYSSPTVYNAEEAVWDHQYSLDGMYHKDLKTVGTVNFVDRGLINTTMMEPYQASTHRCALQNNIGFEVRDYTGDNLAFAVNVPLGRVYVPWLALDGGFVTSYEDAGSLRYRSATARFQGYTSSWKDFAYTSDITSHQTRCANYSPV